MGARPGKHQHNRLFWSLFLGAALVCLGFAWLFTANLGVFKPQLEQWVSQTIGRQFSIDGRLDIHLGRTVTISAEDIHVQNIGWAENADMLTVGRLAAQVDLWSLYSQPIVVDLVDIDDVTLTLAENEAGEKNWEFEDVTGSSQTSGPAESAIGVLLKTLEVDAARLLYENAHRPEAIDLNVDRLRQQLQANGMLDASVSARINGRDVTIDGQLGTWNALLAGRDVTFDIDGQLDTISLHARGHIDDLLAPGRPSFEFSASGPDIAELSAMLGLGQVGEGDINLVASLGADGSGPVRLNADGNLGQTLINAVGSFTALDDLDNIEVDLSARGPNLGRILAYAGIDQVGEESFDLALKLTRQGGDFSLDTAVMNFGDAHIEASGRLPNFPGFDDARVNLEVTGQRVERLLSLVKLPPVGTGPFFAMLTISDTAVDRPNLTTRIETALGTFEAHGPIGDAPVYRGSQFEFDLQVPSLARLGDLLNVGGLPEQTGSASGTIVRGERSIELPLPVTLQTAGVVAAVTGTVNLSDSLDGSALRVKVEGADLHQAAQNFGIDAMLPALPYAVSGDLGIRRKGVALQKMVAAIGSSQFSLDGNLGRVKNFAGTRVSFKGSGPSLEELFSGVDDVDIFPGAFESSGAIELSEDRISIEKFMLRRKRAQVTLDATIGLPVATQQMQLKLDARGPNLGAMFSDLKGLEPAAAPFSVSARIHRDGSRWSFQPLTASYGDATLNANGALSLQEESFSGQLSVALDVPNLADLGRYNERRPNAMALHWSATVSGNRDELVADDLMASIGEDTISGRIAYRPATVPELELELSSDSITVLPIFEPAGEDPNLPPTFQDGRVIPAVELPFDALRKINAEFKFGFGNVQRNKLNARDVRVVGNLRDGALNIETFNLNFDDGYLTAGGALSPDGGGQLSLQLNARKLKLARSSGVPMHTDIDLDLLATGSDLRQLAATSNGIFVFSGAGGQLENQRFATVFYGSFLEEILNAINPFFKTEKYTTLDCVVLPIEISSGQAQANPAFYVQTDKIRIAGRGGTDLKTEQIKLSMRTLPRKKLSLSVGEVLNPYVGIGGTLARPKLAVDAKGALISGGAAAATGGLSILAKGAWDRLTGGKDGCAAAVKQAEELVSSHQISAPD